MGSNREKEVEVLNCKDLEVTRGINARGGTIFIRQNITLVDGKNFGFGTSNGTKFGTGTDQKLGFWNVTPIIQPVGGDQGTLASYATGGFGLDTDAKMQALFDLVVAMRLALVNVGIMKGAA